MFVKFDNFAGKGTFLEQQKKLFNFEALVNLVFPRGDYKELVELTLTYLCPDVNFDIHASGSVSHAHFQSLYII